MRLPGIALIAVLGLLAAATPAPGQVVIDPESPTAKEYAIPLENERRQADPETAPRDGVAQGERSSPLFGAGIEEEPTRDEPHRGDGGGNKSRGGDTADGDGGTGGTAAPDEDAREVVRAATADPGAPDGGIGTSLAIAGVALAVVAIGGGAGLLLRRRG